MPAKHTITLRKPLDEHSSEECFEIGYNTCLAILGQMPSMMTEACPNTSDDQTKEIIQKVFEVTNIFRDTLSLDTNDFDFEVMPND